MERVLNEVTIEILQKCESQCIFCSSNSTLASETKIHFEKICEIIDFCQAHGSKTINLSGGEPLLHDQIIETIEYCSHKGLNTTIYTSGNFNSDIWTRILNSNLEKEKIKFVFNYPSCENDVYQKLIGNKSFQIATLNNAISSLINHLFEVEVHIVPNRLNFASLYSSTAFLKSIKVSKVSFLRLVPQGRAGINREQLAIGNSELQDEIGRIENDLVDKTFSIRGGVPFSRLLANKCECHAGIHKLIFRYDGIVFPCEAFKEAPKNENFVLGSVHDNTFNEIWHNHSIHDRLKSIKQIANHKSEPCPAQMLYGAARKTWPL